jgi:2-C-methyl-D-erythritol 4-phosphate cytidylyltransferase
VSLAGRPLVEWSIAACRASESVRSIVVACPPGHVHDLAGGDLGVVDGGATRAQSVSNALSGVGTELVAIHDAARPLVTPELIEGVVGTLLDDSEADGAIVATPVTDTIKRVTDPEHPGRNVPEHPGRNAPEHPGRNAYPMHDMGNALRPMEEVEETVDRGRLWAAQTPQVFRVNALRAAMAGDPERVAAATDEAMLIEATGGRVLIHPATVENLKVTTPADLQLAELLLSRRSGQ